MATSKKPIFYLARCKECNHHLHSRFVGSLKQLMLAHRVDSHKDRSYGLFSSTIAVHDFKEDFAITRFRGAEAKMMMKLVKNPRFWHYRRNEQKLVVVRI